MIEIRIDTPSFDLLIDYSKVPISFDGHSYFELHEENDHWQLTEIEVPPFFKDYDSLEHPTEWAAKFDMSNWMMFSAFQDAQQVGGAIVATRTPGVNMLEGRDDLAVLWDIRVRSDARGKGIGSQLLTEVMRWSKAQGCTELKIETQQMNVAACKLYEKMGCELREIRKNQYPELPEELQLLWYREL